MFNEIPKLFDRNFAIGYFLPIVTFVAMSIAILNGFDLSKQFLPIIQTDLLIGVTLLGLACWLAGVLLLVSNRGIFMLVEGYGWFNPARLLMGIERWRYRRLHHAITRLKEERREIQLCLGSSDETSGTIAKDHPKTIGSLQNKKNRIEEKLIRLRLASARFPNEASLLPTAFGNTIRAFEEYPSDMYGIDAIEGWNRLLAVIPKDYRELIDTAKAQTDFWLNLWVLSFIVLLEYICVAISMHRLNSIWVPIVTLMISLIASQRAKDSADEWGAFVKASFDLYLPELYKKLGFPHPANRDEERAIWRKFSQAFLYKIPEYMPSREAPNTEEKK